MNFSDKDIASDLMAMCKHAAQDLTRVAAECSNENLRRTIRQMRDQGEQAHNQLTNITVRNNWYLPAAPADHQEVRRVESFYARGGEYQTPAPGGYGYRTETGGYRTENYGYRHEGGMARPGEAYGVRPGEGYGAGAGANMGGVQGGFQGGFQGGYPTTNVGQRHENPGYRQGHNEYR